MRFKKKCLVVFFSVFLLMSLVGFKAQAVANVDVNALRTQVVALQAQITALLQQLEEAEGQPVVWCYDFKIKLGFTNRGEEVKQIQKALQKEGFYKGAIDGNYGQQVASAVTGFQQKYHSDTLAPWGLKYGTGYAGSTTIKKLSAIYGCGVARPTPTPAPTPIPIPVQPYIKVTSPALNSNWVVGETHRIQWYSYGVSGNVAIRIIEAGEGGPYIAMGVDISDGFYDWAIPAGFTTGNKRVLSITTSNTAVNYKDGESAYFSISESPQEQFLKLTSPNGGEQWKVGSSYNITWISAGVDKLNIEWEKSNPDGTRITAEHIVLNVSASAGEYSWKIPSNHPTGSTYRIVIWDGSSIDGSQDVSDNYFSVVEAGQNLLPVIDGLTAPTQLKINQQGTWKLEAHDPENGTLSYAINWGDNSASRTIKTSYYAVEAVQTSTFRHTYSQAGTYTVKFTITDDKQQSVETSATVKVVESSVACTDTDGGIDYYQKGITTVNNVMRIDSCSSSNEGLLFEWYCRVASDGISRRYYETKICAGGCYNGACASPVEETFITVTSPNGWEEWKKGEAYDITWKSNGVKYVKIQLENWEGHPAGGPLTWELEDNMLAITGRYSFWLMGDFTQNINPGKYFKVRVVDASDTSSYSQQVADVSDNYFSIVDSSTSFTCAQLENSKSYFFGLCEKNNYDNVCFDKFKGTYQGCGNDSSRNTCTEYNTNANRNISCPVAEPVEEKFITVISPNGGENWAGSPTITDTIRGYDDFIQYVKWTGVSDDFNSARNDKVRAYLEKYENGQYTTIGRILPFAYGSIGWVVGVVSKTDCDLVYPSSLTNSCFNRANMQVVPTSQYYVRVVDVIKATWDRSDAPFGIVSRSIACVDSDGGKNYQTKGVTRGYDSYGSNINQLATYEDKCDGSDRVMEFYCAYQNDPHNRPGYVTMANQRCPYGCENGACIADPIEPSITIISPNGGELWYTGSAYNIKWNVPDITRVSIDIMDQNTGKVAIVSPGIVAVLPNTGIYQWKIPSAMPVGNYKVRVLGCPDSFSNTACANVGMSHYGYDDSDNYFSIVEKSDEELITVISPNGGEKWTFGNTYDITWESKKSNNTKVYFILGSGASCELAEVPATNERYSVKIEKDMQCLNTPLAVLAGQKYKVLLKLQDVGATEIGILDKSDNYFSITDGNTPYTSCISSDGKDYYVRGNTDFVLNGKSYSITERCTGGTSSEEGDTVVESYCEGGERKVEYHYCEYSCENGACKKGVTVISPNGGESLSIGQTYALKWEESTKTITSFHVYLIDGNGNTFDNLGIGSVHANRISTTVNLNWKVPSSLEPGNYKMRVDACLEDAFCVKKSSDDSDNYFSIVDVAPGDIVSPCGNYGDVNEDGFITKEDSDLILNYGVGNITLTPEQIQKADVSANGTVSAYDSALILQYIEGMITTFSVCSVSALNDVENSLANISQAADNLMERIKELLGR